MKAGAIAEVEGDFQNIDTAGFPVTRIDKGEELQSTLSNVSISEDLSGFQITSGVAAQEIAHENETYSITTDGSIEAEESNTEVITEVADFAGVAGEFVAAEDSTQEFIFELIEGATGTGISPVQLDLVSFADTFSDAQIWMGGFYDHPGPAEKGSAFGRHIISDDNIQEIVQASEIDRLGLAELKYNAQTLKLLVTEGGYVEVYQPGPEKFTTMQFMKFIDDVLMDYVI